MKFLILVSFFSTMVLCQNLFPAKPNVRKLPADVLRDFPGVCFGSSACQIFHVGQSWPLAPFCGRATCLKEGDKLVEKVEDCGLPPKRTAGCRIANEADFQKPYPECCPVYECQEGAKLQYPTQEEIAAAGRERAAKAAAAASAAKASAV
ncbi:uncharacterized protein [Palaemon carinicauda]|uniref:uncharacterized protein n=1 Tax=Palaemon carinicauda TaxID=392227 RepID=UPI0035B5CE82